MLGSIIRGVNGPPGGTRWDKVLDAEFSLAATPFVLAVATQLFARNVFESVKLNPVVPKRER